MRDSFVGNVSTVCCACAGGFLGYAGFVLLLDRGYYALVLPGGLLGLAAGIPRSRSLMVPALCGVLGIVAGLLAEHRFAPFGADPSLGYFLTHATNLQPLTLFLIGLGGLIGFWVPFRRRRRAAVNATSA
jgi:hypothetical protein